MPRLVPILALLALVSLIACPKPAPTVEPEGGGAQVPGGAIDPGPDPAADGGSAAADGGATPSDGGANPTAGTCRSDADCNGGVCEGQGCGDDQPGTCKPVDRMCTRDSRPYCGCDGKTFRGSGSCPGRRYAHAGECGTTP